MSAGDVPLPFDDAEDSSQSAIPADAPCLYVATKITGTAPGSPERQIIDFAVATITDAVLEATRGSGDPWHLRVHAPIEWTSPEQTPDMAEAEIFRRNARIVLTEAAALIVYGWSPSAGVGQEFSWAALTGLPVLYVEPPGGRASRQMLGTPGDVAFTSYATPDHLKDEIRRWIRSRRHQIEAGESRRRDRVTGLGDR